jgi:soluble lytic murein transglycosylase-like protein
MVREKPFLRHKQPHPKLGGSLNRLLGELTTREHQVLALGSPAAQLSDFPGQDSLQRGAADQRYVSGLIAIQTMRACFILIVWLISPLSSAAVVRADPQTYPAPTDQVTAGAASARDSICLMIESAARTNDLPVEYFARVIWQESRFQPNVVGPRTRSGERALGIAQFMPRTAAERRLLDPFDPVEALPKSAAFLAELRDRFGNLGLAAAAYNAGPGRLREFMAGTRALPAETRSYVMAITGKSVDEWANITKSSGHVAAPPAVSRCEDLLALLKQAPNPFVQELQERIDQVATSPWGIELSAGFSRERILAAYAKTLKRLAELLSGHDPSILTTTLRSRGSRPFYQVRIGAPTRESANGLCSKIMRAGGACLVLRNTDRPE